MFSAMSDSFLLNRIQLNQGSILPKEMNLSVTVLCRIMFILGQLLSK